MSESEKGSGPKKHRDASEAFQNKSVREGRRNLEKNSEHSLEGHVTGKKKTIQNESCKKEMK